MASIVALVLVGSGPAWAQTPGPATVTAVENGFDGLSSLVSGTLAPKLFALTVLIIGIVIGPGSFPTTP